ncbi:MAG: hypothetical protein WAW42_15195 [Candidatus Competibacteraceae bacterium]
MRSDDPNSVLDEDELEPLYHLDESGRLTWTEEGKRLYRKRFTRFGLRLEAITTMDDLQTARRISAAGLTDQLLAIAGNGPRSLERNLLVAIARNDDAEYQRLLALLKARNRLGLQVVAGLKGGNSC